MITQAQNSLALYRGGNPHTIAQLLKMQHKSVVAELLAHFGCDEKELPIRLSLGK